jgi:glutamate--cysteine ligase
VSHAARTRAVWVASYLREHCFTSPRDDAPTPLRFGAEMELLVLDAASRRVVPIDAAEGPSSLRVVRDVAARFGWREVPSAKGVPRFVAASGGALTFEPGGQLEYSSAVHRSVSGLLRELYVVHHALDEHARAHGIALLARGIDPENGADAAPLQIDAERYQRMARYLAAIGPAGARMMRQTASLQLCVGGVDIAAQWPVANALAPWLVAIFANSRRYAGADTRFASARAETWRDVDPRRTGIFPGDDPVREYAAFALGAPAFLVGPSGAPVRAFGALADDALTPAALATHLSTLFPEVRPRGYLELRSIDAIDVRHHAAALVLVTGLLADDVAANAAREILGEPSVELLRAAGRDALADHRLGARVEELMQVALAGCARLGEALVSVGALADARDGFDELLSRYASPAAVASAGGS